MKHMNEFDLQSAQRRYGNDTNGAVPNRAKLSVAVAKLADWTNSVSDGWAYWPKPRRAAQVAIGHIESTSYPEHDRRRREDITDAELVAALKPIKAMLTRHADLYGASHLRAAIVRIEKGA